MITILVNMISILNRLFSTVNLGDNKLGDNKLGNNKLGFNKHPVIRNIFFLNCFLSQIQVDYIIQPDYNKFRLLQTKLGSPKHCYYNQV